MRTEQAKVRRRVHSDAPVQVTGVDISARTEDRFDPSHEDRVISRVVRPVRSASPVLLPEPSPSLSPEIHFGILLRRARERRGLTLQDVVRVTRISERWLPALEEARLDLLPAPVFVAGYVRSYARMVGLDEGDLLDRYQALVQQRQAQIISTEPEPDAPLVDLAARRRKVLAVGCTVLLLIALICLWLFA